MVKSFQLFFFSAICNSYAVLGGIIIETSASKHWSSHTVKSKVTSTSHAAAIVSNSVWKADTHKSSEQYHPLSLSLAEPAVLQVVNYGPDNSKIEILDYSHKIGETNVQYSKLSPPNILVNSNTEDTFIKVNKGKAHLSKGNHVIYLQPDYAENMMENVLSFHFANVRLLPEKKKPHKSRLFKRYQDKYDKKHEEDDEWDEDNDEDNREDIYSEEKWWRWEKTIRWIPSKETAEDESTVTVFLPAPTTDALLALNDIRQSIWKETVTSTTTMIQITTAIISGPPVERLITQIVSIPSGKETIKLAGEVITTVQAVSTTTIPGSILISIIQNPGITTTIISSGEVITVTNLAQTTTIANSGTTQIITLAAATETVIQPGQTTTITEPGVTETITQAGSTQIVSLPGIVTTIREPGETFAINNLGLVPTIIVAAISGEPFIIAVSAEEALTAENSVRTTTIEKPGVILTTTTTEVVSTTIIGSTFTSNVATEIVTQTLPGMTRTISETITINGSPATYIAQTLINTVTIPLSIRDVTHYLLRETVMRTIFATMTTSELITVNVTTETLILSTSTAIENVVVTVIGTSPTSTLTATDPPVIVTAIP